MNQESWETATLLWPLADPLGSEDFAGEPVEMSAAHQHRKALEELRKKPKASEINAAAEEVDDETVGAHVKRKQWEAKAKVKADARE